MTEESQRVLVIDPDRVPEILCDGKFNVTVRGSLATLTFTHVRPEATALLSDGTVNVQAVVRARIVLTMHNLVALRDLLNRVIHTPDAPTPPAGGITRH
jgi:hypothetical protein